MSGAPNVPTQDELDRLEESARLDPVQHFVSLGMAYLALGRARDAAQIGAQGLRGDPSNLDGRLMVGQALVALHQWKQAQAELLKVVRLDKQNREGFRLLGEVLMRRADYDRALPVLQHAQNIDPANPAVLALLKRARVAQPLDPPTPIPSPRPPAPSARSAPAAPSVRPAPRPALPVPGPSLPRPRFDAGAGSGRFDDEAPTRVAEDVGGVLGSVRDDATEPSVSAVSESDVLGVSAVAEAQIRERLPLQSAGSGPNLDPAVEPARPRPKQRSVPPPMAPPVLNGAGDAAKPRVRPRINPAERRADAAREGLRQSAAMGEDYLNQLLAGGLLDLPNVEVPPAPYAVDPDKRWGRSSKRAFIFLFTLLFLATAGTTTWYIYSKKQKEADVAKRLDVADSLVNSGALPDLQKALSEARAAIARDRSSKIAVAVFAKVAALSTLLYATDPQEAEWAVGTVNKAIKPGDRGYRELVIAEAALTMARLGDIEKPRERLAEVHAKLEKNLAEAEDPMLRWLLGRAQLAAGNRSGAKQSFQMAASESTSGSSQGSGAIPVVAIIERADLLLDEARYDASRKLYEQALAKAPNHPLAVVGLAILRAETSTDLTGAVDDLNVHLTRIESPRVDAYKNLAFAYARYALQDYADFEKYLAKAVGVAEPRFWARVGLARMLAGNVRAAADARQRIQWFNPEGTKREDDPLVRIFDAELSLALGRPKAALSKVGKMEGLRAHSVRGRASFARGAFSEAIREFDAALKIAADDRELKAFQLAATAMARKGSKRRIAMKALDELRLDSKSKVPSYLEGLVLLFTGKLGDARYALQKSLNDITADEPNRLAYRSHLALAEIAYRRDSLDNATAELNASLELNSVYLPTLSLLGRVQLKQSDWEGAMDSLGQVVASGDSRLATWRVELGYAEAVMRNTGGGAPDKDARAGARAAVLRAKDLGADPIELARVAQLVDGSLGAELGVPGAPTPAPKKNKKRRRRRR